MTERCRRRWLRTSARALAGLTTIMAVLAARQSRSAAAEPPPPELTLTWQAPAECPAAADVEAQFARLLGGGGRRPTTKHLTATATVQRTAGDTWTVHLQTMLDGVPGRRTLEGDSCWTVASAASLILALTIDPNAAAEWSPPPSPPPPVPTEPVVAAVPAVTRGAPAATGTAARPFVRPFGGLTLALLPQPALTAGLAAGLRRGRWRGELSGLVTQQRQHTATDRPSAGGDFRLWAGGARACWDAADTGRLIPRLCAGAELEHITARGFGVASPGSGSATIGAATAHGVLAWLVTDRVELALEVGVAGRPYHPTFRLGNVGDVFAVPGWSWATALSVAINL